MPSKKQALSLMPINMYLNNYMWVDNECYYLQQVKAALCAATYPNVAVMDDSSGRAGRPGWTDGTADVHIHPASVNHGLETAQFARPYLVYLEKVNPLRMQMLTRP